MDREGEGQRRAGAFVRMAPPLPGAGESPTPHQFKDLYSFLSSAPPNACLVGGSLEEAPFTQVMNLYPFSLSPALRPLI